MLKTKLELNRIRAIALSIDEITDQLAQLPSLESLGACLELRLAYAELGQLDDEPMPSAERRPPLPRADLVDSLRDIALQLQTLPSSVRIDDPVMSAAAAVRAARQYLR